MSRRGGTGGIEINTVSFDFHAAVLDRTSMSSTMRLFGWTSLGRRTVPVGANDELEFVRNIPFFAGATCKPLARKWEHILTPQSTV